MNDVTLKYLPMMRAFDADLELAIEFHNLGELQQLIDSKDSVVLQDIDLLSELEFNLRHGKLKIVKVGD